MAEAIYLLCAVTSVACALLLLKAYRVNRTRLLFWSGLCFAGLAVSNVILVVDLMIIATVDFGLVRSGAALAALVVLIFGLIWESK